MRGVATMVLAFAAFAAAQPPLPNEARAEHRQLAVLDQIERYQAETWRWQRLMRLPKTPMGDAARHTAGHAYRVWVLGLWRERARRARRRAHRPPDPSCLALHPPARGPVVREHGQRLLRRPADGSRLPAALRPRAPAPEGNGGPLDAARADLGGRARAPERPWLPPLAGHGPTLRAHLAAPPGGRRTANGSVTSRPLMRKR